MSPIVDGPGERTEARRQAIIACAAASQEIRDTRTSARTCSPPRHGNLLGSVASCLEAGCRVR